MSKNTGKTRRAGQQRCKVCKAVVPDIMVPQHYNECTTRNTKSAKRKRRKT